MNIEIYMNPLFDQGPAKFTVCPFLYVKMGKTFFWDIQYNYNPRYVPYFISVPELFCPKFHNI